MIRPSDGDWNRVISVFNRSPCHLSTKDDLWNFQENGFNKKNVNKIASAVFTVIPHVAKKVRLFALWLRSLFILVPSQPANMV